MASIVGTDLPKLQETSKISFVVPNKLMQDQFQKGRPKLLSFLREKLNNYAIEILVILNEKQPPSQFFGSSHIGKIFSLIKNNIQFLIN